MPYLEHRQRLHRLLQGEHPLGRGEGCAVQIQGIPTGRYAVLRASESGVYLRALSGKLRLEVNGEPVTSKGRALSHGDRIRLGKAELLFIDETQVGGTATAEAASPVQEAEETEGEGLADYADAGGMLTRRRDGSRLPVAAPLFRIGREAGCDLVVPESAVSRVHAEVRYQGGKYVLYDLSANGTWVNERRISRSHVLSRGDVVKVGSQLFEFFCESVPLTPAEKARRAAAGRAAEGAETTERVLRPKRRGGLWVGLLLLLAAGAALAYFLL